MSDTEQSWLCGLRDGDMIRNSLSGNRYIVTDSSRMIAVATVNYSNPDEWEHVMLPPREADMPAAGFNDLRRAVQFKDHGQDEITAIGGMMQVMATMQLKPAQRVRALRYMLARAEAEAAGEG